MWISAPFSALTRGSWSVLSSTATTATSAALVATAAFPVQLIDPLLRQ